MILWSTHPFHQVALYTPEMQLVRLLRCAGNVPSNASGIDPLQCLEGMIVCVVRDLQCISAMQLNLFKQCNCARNLLVSKEQLSTFLKRQVVV